MESRLVFVANGHPACDGRAQPGDDSGKMNPGKIFAGWRWFGLLNVPVRLLVADGYI